MRKTIGLLLAAVLLTACGGGGEEGGEQPVINKDFLSVTPNLELLGDGQTTEMTVSSNCNWTINKDVDWLTVSPMTGSGTQSVTVSATKNTSGENRMAVLTVQGGSLPPRMVTVTQLKVTDQTEPSEPASHEPGAGDNLPPS